MHNQFVHTPPLLKFIRIIGKPNDALSRRAPAAYNACPMMLTDREEFNAMVQLTAAIISRVNPNPAVPPPEMRREAIVKEAHELMRLIAARVAQEHSTKQ
jgi:hypothetical protein